MIRSQAFYGVFALCGAVAILSSARAADAPGATTATLEEVVVTAEKRSENVQNIASTVTAISAEVLLEQGVKDITDLARVAPEVTVQTGLFTNIGIRGVRTGAFGPSTDSPNAVHVDGVYMARFTGMNGFFYDTERLEVLAGPQGTLYGRNSAGGAINLITNKPTFDSFGGRASVDYGNYNALNVNGAINLPVSNNFAMRLAYLHNSRNGYNTDTGLDDALIDSGRFEALWKPSDKDSLLFTVDEEKIGGKTPGPGTNIETVLKDPSICTNNATQAVAFASAAGTCPAGQTFTQLAIKRPSDPRNNLVFAGNSERAVDDGRNKGLLLQYDHNFSPATLTVEIGHRTADGYYTGGSLTGYQHDPRLFTAGLLRLAAPSIAPQHSNWDSQEIRLVSASETPVKWQVGVFNFHEKATDNHNGAFAVAYPNPGTVGAGPFGSNYGQYVLLTDANGNNIINSDVANILNDDKARAVFGQATWTPPELSALHITGGVRYNWEEKHGIVYTISPVTRLPIPAANIDQTKKWTKTTYKANIAFDIRPQNMVYVDHSTGFKSGGFAYGVTAAYDPEYLDSWEIGSKNRFLDNRLQVNFSAWQYDYTNQVTTIPQYYYDPTLVPVNGNGVGNTITTVNAGNSKIKGQSLDVQFAVTADDELSLNVQHLTAVYNNFDLTALYTKLHYFAFCTAQPDGATPAGGCTGGAIINLQPGISATGDQSGPSVNYTGTRAGANPVWGGNLTYDHNFHALSAAWDAQLSYHYTGSRLNGNQAAPNTTNSFLPLDAFSTVDFSLRYRPGEAKWSVLGYVRNATDKLYRVARGFTSNNGGVQYNPATAGTTVLPNVNYAYTTAAYGAPRTFGVAFDASF